MTLTPKKINLFSISKVTISIFVWCAIKKYNDQQSTTSVKFRWINQNPFGSMFWAVQGMAAELATGVLVMQKIKASGKNISMLVASNNAEFTKKAKGRITFCCNDGEKLDAVIRKLLKLVKDK